ncbi:hypothetical protein GOBAR_DD31281 [Gossypium barbadense]|nr:hypothetical protein GOBAR_DD31281 [Gossypium barbadense]
MSSDEEYYIILHVGGHFVKDPYVRYAGVESDGEGDMERLESGGEGEGDVRGVPADWEGVSATSIEVDKYVGMESDGQISLGSTVGEDNDSEVTVDEYASDFATSNGVDNIAIAVSREVEDGNETEKRVIVRCIASPNYPWRIRASYSPVAKCLQVKMFQDEHHCLVSFKNKMVTATMIAQHFEAIIKDHPKMKLSEIQRRCASKIHDYAHELGPKTPESSIKMVVQRVTADSLILRVEGTDSWTWFLSLLSTNLGLEDRHGYAIINDQQKDLEIAISDILPMVEHRNYVKHVFANWSGRKLGKSYECDF